MTYKYKHLNSFQDFGWNKYSVLHLFNGVSYNRKPWVCTFETAVPRWGNIPVENRRKGYDLLASDACKALIAISNCAKNIQQFYLEEHAPDLLDEIMKKVVVIHPAQKLIIQSVSEKNTPKDQLHFLFVGNQFFAKGGMEVVETLKKYKDEYDIKLTLISVFAKHRFIFKNDEEDIDGAKAFIEENSDWITCRKNLPNTEVIELLKSSHVAFMPTYADTYGYFVLEAKACGCPIVTTDIRALPEINNDDSGWLIEVPKNDLGYGLTDGAEELEAMSEQIKIGLDRVIKEIVAHPERLEIKAQKALEEIKQNHDPQEVAARLEAIYDKIG